MEFSVPSKPYFITRTHIKSNLDINSLVSRVQIIIDKIEDLENDFNNQYVLWNSFFLKGSLCSTIAISIYKEDDTTFIVETNRLSGDHQIAHLVFNYLKKSLANIDLTINKFIIPSIIEIPTSDKFQLILNSIKQDDIQDQIKAKIICDCTKNLEMHKLLEDNGCIDILSDIIKTHLISDNQDLSTTGLSYDQIIQKSGEHTMSIEEYNDTRLPENILYCIYAIIALSNLSIYCKKSIIDSGVIPILSLFVLNNTNIKYNRRRIRYEAANIIANICESFPDRIRNIFKDHDIIFSLDHVNDVRLIPYVERIINL